MCSTRLLVNIFRSSVTAARLALGVGMFPLASAADMVDGAFVGRGVAIDAKGVERV